MIAVDTNILIYAHRGETELHEAAVSRLAALAEGAEKWALPVFCVTEFLRAVTDPRVFDSGIGRRPGHRVIQSLAAAPSCDAVRPGPEFLEILVETARRTQSRANPMFDAQIAALCQEHGIDTVPTNNRDLERFEPLKVRRLE